MPCFDVLHWLPRLWCNQITCVMNVQLLPHPAESGAVSGVLLWQGRRWGLPRYVFLTVERTYSLRFFFFLFLPFFFFKVCICSVLLQLCVFLKTRAEALQSLVPLAFVTVRAFGGSVQYCTSEHICCSYLSNAAMCIYEL